MDIAISSLSPLPMGGYPLEGVAPDAQGFGALLQGGDSSPPVRVETVEAGPSDKPVQGGRTCRGDDLGANHGAASQALPPAAPSFGVQPQPPAHATPAEVGDSSAEAGGQPLPMPRLLQGGELGFHKALVVAAPLDGRYAGLGAPGVAPADNNPGLVSGLQTTEGAEIQPTEAKVVAFRMPPQVEGASTDPLPKTQTDTPTVGGSGQSDTGIGAVHRNTNMRPGGATGADAGGEVQQNKDRLTLETATQPPGGSDVQRLKAKVVAAALIGRNGFEVPDSLTERPSDRRDVIEPTSGTGAVQQQSRVLGKPVSGSGLEQAGQEGTQRTTRSGDVERPSEQHGGDLQHHKATVVGSRLAPRSEGTAAEAATSPKQGPGLQDSQQGTGEHTNGRTVTPTVSAVRIRLNDTTTQEAVATGRDSRLGTSGDPASGGVERAQASVRSAPVAAAVTAYSGSEVRAPAQPFPRLDYQF